VETRVSALVKVEREDVHVMFMRASEDALPAIQRAWAEFELAVGLKGRKFFGTFDNSTGEYRVCTQLKPDDDPEALGFEVGTLPGGTYLRARLEGEPPAIYAKIGSTFDDMVKQVTLDASRPWIEYYRRHDVIHLLLPIDGL
jgi:hypothetical protein